MAYANKLDLANISTWNGDLSAFKNRGGKLQTYHGLADPLITSTNSERYYTHVSETMNLPPSALDNWYRFYKISGMSHCLNGGGAWEIGQSSSNVPASASQNILFSLIAWVENGQAPDTILGTKYVNDTRSLGVSFQRSHCRYPYRNTYVGGNPNLPSSWICESFPKTVNKGRLGQ
jgi:feruloyl esterase